MTLLCALPGEEDKCPSSPPTERTLRAVRGNLSTLVSLDEPMQLTDSYIEEDG